MGNLAAKRNTLGMMAIILPLLGLLTAAVWFAASAWTSLSGPPMPMAGYVAMVLGVVFSLVIGIGLMALLFYSSRHGYDEQVYEERHLAEEDRD